MEISTMPSQHKYRLMRPHSNLVDQMPGEYPQSVNTALSRYLYLALIPPKLEENEWNLIYDACNGWSTQIESPAFIVTGFSEQIKDSIVFNDLDSKWQVDKDQIMQKIESFTPQEILAAIHKVEQFWATPAE